MNTFEKFVYNLVKSNPRLKMRVRDAYQAICDFIPVRRNYTHYPISIREGYFFGFHDKSPWSFDDKYLLAHHELIPLRMPTKIDKLEVGYFDGPDCMVFHKIGETTAWNWHQGAQLQWIGNSHEIAFNDFDGEKHVTRVVNLNGDVQRTLPLPISAVSRDGKMALSYSFARLRGSPHGYAYYNGVDPEEGTLIPSESGLSIMNTDTGDHTNLFSVADLAAIEPEPSMQGAFHYFSHAQFSPDGSRFKFFHRWTIDDNSQVTRMITADIDGSNVHIINTSGMVSHVAWRDNSSLVAYARRSEFGDAYYEFTDNTNDAKIIGPKQFSSDGHPAFGPDKRWMLTDTYADRFRRRFLSLFDMDKNERYDIAMFYSPQKFAGVSIADHLQCDFHPRWDRSGEQICFDSAHTGTRSLCTLKLGNPSKTEIRAL